MQSNRTKMRILHVDDEQDTLEVVKTILEKENFEVVSVASGREALQKIESNNYSLVIIDIMMSDMTGWELFTRIAKIKPNYKIIFLTILEVSKEKLNIIKNSGIKDYIKKPFDQDDLVARVKNVIKNI